MPQRLRILVLAPGSNPKSITGPLIGYMHADALARIHQVTLVVTSRDAAIVREANGHFSSIESVPMDRVYRAYDWLFSTIFRKDRGNLLWTAIRFPLPILFERRAWRMLKHRVVNQEFDVVLRLLPIVPMMPSPFAYYLRKGPIPFVIGPLNGGVPWPKGFSQIARQRSAAGNWAAGLRDLYRFLPYARSTYANAAAIISGSSHTCDEFIRFKNKLFYVSGENGLPSSSIVRLDDTDRRADTHPLSLVYVGRLVPYKACDIAIRASASLIQSGRARLRVIGDGPERQRLQKLAETLSITTGVEFCGWLKTEDVLHQLRQSDALLFPSLREFGGGVVFEALSMGAVPIVVDHGGPGDIVLDGVGFRVPLTNEADLVAQIESCLNYLDANRSSLWAMRQSCVEYARKHLTWDSKALAVTEVLHWVLGIGRKPTLAPPKWVRLPGMSEIESSFSSPRGNS